MQGTCLHAREHRGDTESRKESNVTDNSLPQASSVSFEGLKKTNDYPTH